MKYFFPFCAFERVCKQFGPFSSSILSEDAQLEGEAVQTHSTSQMTGFGCACILMYFCFCFQFSDASIFCIGGTCVGYVCVHTHTHMSKTVPAEFAEQVLVFECL